MFFLRTTLPCHWELFLRSPLGNTDAPLGKEFLHLPIAARASKLEPDRITDNLGWELVASIGARLHSYPIQIASNR
jgi:hypothetical protein